MRSAMAHWGPDGVRVWRSGPVALGLCLLHDTPESVAEELPYQGGGTGFALTAEARLDNRPELCRALGIVGREQVQIPDGTLVRLAFEKWQANAPRYLLGDWSFAAYVPSERRLFLARDHFGVTALYYVRDDRRVAFASDRRALLTLENAPHRLNELYLAQVLVVWPAFYGPDTSLVGLHRLPPAHAMCVSPAGHRLWRYWRLEDVPPFRVSTADDAAEGLREHLNQAVDSRTRSLRPVSVTLSAGLDSGSVAVLAAGHLAKRSQRLTAFTAVPAYPAVDAGPRVITNEFHGARAVAHRAGIVDHIAVPAADVSPYEGLERMLRIHGEPSSAAVSNYYWVTALLGEARRRDVGVLLIGQLGNASCSWPGRPSLAWAAEALLNGRFGSGSGETARWILASRPLRPFRLWRGSRRLVGGREPWRPYSAINPALARQLDLLDRMTAAGYDPTFGRSFRNGRDEQLRILSPGADVIGAIWAELGASAGLAVRDPTMDVRLVSYVIGIPNRFWRGPIERWLIRRSMQGLIPDDVRLSTRRGLQSADLIHRLRAHSGEGRSLLAEVAASDVACHYVDVPYLEHVQRRVEACHDDLARRAAVDVLLRGLGIAVFAARQTR